MFNFKEDLKAQRGPFEDEKNIKGWGVLDYSSTADINGIK